MDWSKAKTILIVVLLAMCLVLTGVLFSRELATRKQIKENKEAAISYLESVGVKLETEIPTKRIKLPVLFVEFKKENSSNLNLTFENYTVYTNDIGSANYTITSKGEHAAEIMQASSAVLEAATRFYSQELVIKNIELCYYINNDFFGIANGSMDTAFPAWRIETSAGYCFVQAY